MYYSSINWHELDFKTLAAITTLPEVEIASIFDSSAGFHIVNGKSSHSEDEIIKKVTWDLRFAVEIMLYKKEKELDIESAGEIPSPEEVEPSVKKILDGLNIVWSSSDVRKLMR